ncbi:MAG: hypothetical protein LBF22_08425 [Deltaproteobacteria bacterium]|jgi:hypothetical protein|nr:hypothetical protein [Deltaproteobacteria bacterium]
MAINLGIFQRWKIMTMGFNKHVMKKPKTMGRMIIFRLVKRKDSIKKIAKPRKRFDAGLLFRDLILVKRSAIGYGIIGFLENLANKLNLAKKKR